MNVSQNSIHGTFGKAYFNLFLKRCNFLQIANLHTLCWSSRYMIYDELLGMPKSETVEPKTSPKSPGVFVSLCDREFYENPARFIYEASHPLRRIGTPNKAKMSIGMQPVLVHWLQTVGFQALFSAGQITEFFPIWTPRGRSVTLR